MIGVEIFGRAVDYDTGSDSVVRVAASEVRKRLNQFYLESGETDWQVRFDLPTGTYVPSFNFSELKVEPSGELEGNDLQAPKLVPEATSPEKEEQAETAAPALAAREKSGRFSLWVAAVLVLLAILSVGTYKASNVAAYRNRQIRSLLVLPLKNLSGDPNEDYLADGMTAGLINSMGQISTLRVISLTTSMNLKGSTKMTPEIARELNVQGVIEGSVQREGSHIRINVQLIDGADDRPIWTQTYLRDVDSILNLQGEVAADILREVTTPVSPQQQNHLTRILSTNSDAQAAYMRGLLLLNAYKDRDALIYIQKAVQADPKFAQAHAALAECVGRLAVAGLRPNRDAFITEKSEALQAISIDPSLAEPHAELAEAVIALDRDWQTAGQEYRRALELNPNSAEIHQKYATFLIFQGDTKEAIDEVDTGANLDPTSAFAIRNQIFVYFYARKYDKVLSLINTARSLGIHPPGSDFFLGATYTEEGQYQNSIEWYLKAQVSPHTLGHLGNVYALAGQRQAAYGVINKLRLNVQDQGIGQYELALVYDGLGDKKSALQWLKRASDANDVGLLYIKVDPFLDPLRGEPEFQDLVKRTGLKP